MSLLKDLKILFIGDMTVGHCANSLMEGFKEFGFSIKVLSTSKYMHNQSIGSREWFQRRYFKKPSEDWINKFKLQVTEATLNWRPDIVFCINTIHIPQDILHEIKCRLKVHLSFDDVSNSENLTDDYLVNESNWDLIFTNKLYNVTELEARTKSQVIFFENAYNPKIHNLKKSFGIRNFDIGFIGARRNDRRNLPKLFKEANGLATVVAGPRWKRSYPLGVKGVTIMPEKLDHEYTRIGNDIKVGICLLNSANRDQVTTRSFELPALGQLIIGQKSQQHEELLEHGVEAFWFDTVPEMIEFSKIVLHDKFKSENIAMSGYRKITLGKNTYADRAMMMLRYFL